MHHINGFGNGFGNGHHANGGTNGTTNGNSNGVAANGNNSSSADGSCWEKGIWSVGIINAKHKYLTAETFGFKINANGTSLKKKQTWLLEPSGEGDTICLRSHLDRYLAVDQYGNVTCDATEKEPGAYFEIHVRNESGELIVLANNKSKVHSDTLVCGFTDSEPGAETIQEEEELTERNLKKGECSTKRLGFLN